MIRCGRRAGRIHQIRKTESNTPKWGLPGKSKLSERCNVKENMLFSITEKQVHHKNRRYCLILNSTGIQNKGNKSKSDDWLLYISVILIGTFSSSSRLKFPTQFFSHVRTSSRVSLVEMITTLCVKLQRTSIFFYLSLILSMFLTWILHRIRSRVTEKICLKRAKF